MSLTFSEQLVALLSPMNYSGTADLTSFLNGLGSIFEIVEEYASDDGTAIGYSLLVDIDRCPDEAVPWLAQFVGVQLVTGLPADTQRASVEGLGSWKRGSISALQAAPVPYLTGSKSVTIIERDTSAWHFEAKVIASEVVSSALVLAALISQKAAGLQMNYVEYAGQGPFTVRRSIVRGGTTPPDGVRLFV